MNDLRELRRLEPQFYRAPSAHNAQPWVFEYAPDRIELHFDRARELPAGDPTRRDLLLSLGAIVEAVLIAAAAAETSVGFEPAFDSERRRVGAFVPATALYETSFTPDDLARRQTSRLEYAPGRLTDDDLAAARVELGGDARLHELAAEDVVNLYVAADRHLYDSQPVVEELRWWLRLSRRHPRYAEDGLTYECLALKRAEAAVLALLLRRRVYPLVRAVRLHRTFTAATKSLLKHEGSVLVLTAVAETPEEVLAHGRTLLRVWLALARRGLYTHPLSQILDFEATERDLAERVGASGWRPLSVFRVGRSESPARSSRLR
jgi:nitroreductase